VSLRDYGWSSFFSDSFDALDTAGLEPGRVLETRSGFFRLITESGGRTTSLAGKLKHAAGSAAALPAVGDWVACRPAGAVEGRIEHLLPRRTRLSRKVSGRRSAEQIVAANVDKVFLVMGLDGDFNPRRLERLLTTAWESGSEPVILLTKLDLCDKAEELRGRIAEVASGVPIVLVSCISDAGVEDVRRHLAEGETGVLLGSSGVGKSTLINRLLGEAVQKTAAVREDDDRGRHTTTHRELFRLPGAGLLIDGPGIRELQLWAEDESVTQAFEDIATLAASCRFRGCRHDSEPGCAIRGAVEDGTLDSSRLDNYRTLRKELAYLERRQDQNAQQIEKKKWREIHKEMRRSSKNRQKK